jgi:DNA polymerase III alpha subunit
MRVRRFARCDEVPHLASGARVELAGVITGLTVRRTTRGKSLAFFSLVDATGTARCLCFPARRGPWASCLQDGRLVLVSASVQVSPAGAWELVVHALAS